VIFVGELCIMSIFRGFVFYFRFLQPYFYISSASAYPLTARWFYSIVFKI